MNKKLNYLKMLIDINKIVENDWAAEMEIKLIPNSKKYTQKESREMADAISKVYSISHAIDCPPCAKKYIKLWTENNGTHYTINCKKRKRI